MGYLKKIWDGELPLVKVFWIYSVGVGALLAVILALISVSLKDYPEALLILTIAYIFYHLIVFVGIWRSANSYTNYKVWAIFAKFHAAFGLLSVIGGLVHLIDTKTESVRFENTALKSSHKLASLSNSKWQTLSDGEVVKWLNNRECYVYWDEKVEVVDAPISFTKFREIQQEDELVVIVYFPQFVTDSEIKAVIDKEAFLKLKQMCHKD